MHLHLQLLHGGVGVEADVPVIVHAPRPVTWPIAARYWVTWLGAAL